MERKLASVVTACYLQLSVERLLVDAYSHRGNLYSAVECIVVEHNIAVERPVVVVGRSAIVGLARAKRSAYLHNNCSPVFARKGVFTLLARHIGVHLFKLECGNRLHITAKACLYFGEFLTEHHPRIAYRVYYTAKTWFRTYKRRN